MTYSFRPARRSEAKPLIGLYSESGCGKTYGALMLARGFVGPTGRIGMIETESGRGEAYADIIPGGYEVLPVRDNFSPENYGRALTAAEAHSLDALIIDSASHEWESAGGVLAMAADNQAAGKKGQIVWQKPKMDHQRHFIQRILSTPIPLVIVCMRAKYPMIERKDASGKKEWTRSEMLEPKQSDDILYEMFVHGWIDREHRLHVTKYTRPDLKEVVRDNEPITIETGARLAKWARGDGSVQGCLDTPPAPEPAAPGLTLPSPGAATDSEPSSADVKRWDGALTVAAEWGELSLEAQWKYVPKNIKPILKAALDRRHKPRAAEVDLAKETA